jgi:hypothetical protein
MPITWHKCFERLLSPKAAAHRYTTRQSAYGQKQTFLQAQKSPALGGASKAVWQIRATGKDGAPHNH